MSTKLHRPYYSLLLLYFVAGAVGQNIGGRGDVFPESSAEVESDCSCNGSIAGSVIITTVVVLILVALWWCYARRRAKRGYKADPEAACRAAYDNPHFQGDESDQPDGGQTRFSTVSSSQSRQQISTSPCPSAKVTTTATNTTSTLERGKTTLEKVISAVIGSGRHGSAKRTKDDSFTFQNSEQVTVGLQGHDFTGLGFTVHGNLKEGLFVKDVMSRGPASQSGLVVSGDRIVGLTVLTDHIVYEDALTILSYASPYPVLLHLEKGSVTLPVLTPKAKSARAACSASALIHPSFKSQSTGDLHKIKSLDVEKLKIGTIVPADMKKRVTSLELPRVQNTRHVQRTSDNRHSERAIDVPGIEIKTTSIILDTDKQTGDKGALTSVQVHRPSSPTDLPEASLKFQLSEDAKLSGVTDCLDSDEKVTVDCPVTVKPDPKTKFGVKVLPDLGFLKRPIKTSASDIERGDKDLESAKVTILEMRHENEFEKNAKHHSPSSEVTINVDAPEINVKVPRFNADEVLENFHNEKQNSDGKYGFEFDFKDESQDKSSSVVTDTSDVTGSSLEKQTSKDNNQILKESDSDNEENSKKGNYAIKFGVPDLPSFGVKTSDKTDKESTEDTFDKENSRETGLKIGLPDINLPTYDLSDKTVISVSKPDVYSEHETSELAIPSVHLEKDLQIESKMLERSDHSCSGTDVYIDHDCEFPSLKMKEKCDPGGTNEMLAGAAVKGQYTEHQLGSDSEGEKEAPKSKHGFKFGLLDIDLPTFHLKRKKKDGKENDTESDSDINLKEKIEGSDFSLTKFKGTTCDSSEDDKTGEKAKVDISVPDISIPILTVRTEEQDFEDKLLKNKKSDESAKDETGEDDQNRKHISKYGVFETPDINLPSFNNRKKKSRDLKCEAEISPDMPKVNLETKFASQFTTAPGDDVNLDIQVPSVNVPDMKIEHDGHRDIASDKENDKKESDDETSKKEKQPKEKSGFSFKFRGPDISFPHFSGKSDKNTKELSGKVECQLPESDVDVKSSNVTVEIPELTVKNSVATSEVLDARIESQKLTGPNDNLDTTEKSNTGISSKEVDKVKKSKFGINFKAPEFSIPTVNFRGKRKNDKSADQKVQRSTPKVDVDINNKITDLPDLNVDLPNTVTMKKDGSINIDIETPSLSVVDGKSLAAASDKDSEDISLVSAGLQSKDLNFKDDSERDVDTDGQDFRIPSLKYKTQAEENENASDDSNSDQQPKCHSGLNLKIDLPEFLLPKLSSDIRNRDINYEETEGEVKITSLDTQLTGPDISVTELPSKPREKEDVSHISSSGNILSINTQDISFPDARLSDDTDSEKQYTSKVLRDVDAKFDISEPNVSFSTESSNLQDEERKRKKHDFDFKFNLPDFSDIKTDLSKNEERKMLEANYSLPDELKVEATKRDAGDFEIHTSSMHIKLDSPDLISNDYKFPSLSSPDLGFEDDRSKPSKIINADVEGRCDHRYTVELPEISVPEWTSGNKTNIRCDEETSAKNISLDSNLPDIDNDFIDEEMSDELNITDATKKKRFGFRVKGPDFTMTDFMKRSSSSTDSNEQEPSMEDNQSDEMKSLNLKFKAPGISMTEGRSSRTDYERAEDDSDIDKLRVKLPRVKIPALRSKFLSDEMNQGKIAGATGYANRKGKKISDIDISSPDFTIDAQHIYKESDEWKIKGVDMGAKASGMKIPNAQFKLERDDEFPEDDREHVRRYNINGTTFKHDVRDLEFDVNDPDFVIPDLKTISGYSVTALDIDDPTLDIRADRSDENSYRDKSAIPNYSVNFTKNVHNYRKENTDQELPTESKLYFSGNAKLSKIGKEQQSAESKKLTDINVSLDSSSLELESDLPEADSDFKKALLDFPTDISFKEHNMSKHSTEKKFSDVRQDDSPENDDRTSNKFGMAFGFQGFKKHIEIDGLETGTNESQVSHESLKNVEPLSVKPSHAVITEDLPEADYHLDLHVDSEKCIPERDQQQAAETDATLQKQPSEATESDSDKEKSRKSKHKLHSEAIRHSEALAETSGKMTVEHEKEKLKPKIGLGLGLKGYTKSSDGEDTEGQTKVSIEADGDSREIKEKQTTKTKKAFSFKAFGRSSSDTDEENTEKISENPNIKHREEEEKVKLRNKSSLTFGFKQKHSTDSDDNGEIDKVDSNLHSEGVTKKQKIKSNLGFGFMHKSKNADPDHTSQHEQQTAKKDHPGLDESGKSLGKKVPPKDSRYDVKSESEEEKLSKDPRGEEVRSKSRYGINFGFRKLQGKTSSDSEGCETEEQKVNLDERGSKEKIKEPKSKSLKLGFKGFKNLKGKIQSEINKIRHDSPSSDDEEISREEEHGEKRKKQLKKKEKEKKIKRDTEGYLDTSEETAIASAALAAKDRRKRRESKSSSSSSSTDTSSEDEFHSVELKKKKKTKVKRREEGRIVATDVKEVTVQQVEEAMEVDENIIATARSVSVELPDFPTVEATNVAVVSSELSQNGELETKQTISKQSVEIHSSPQRYVVVREMKLKPSPAPDFVDEVMEVIEKVERDRKVPSPVFPEEGAAVTTETDVADWGSDSDMEKRQNNDTSHFKASVHLNDVPGKQRLLTDSEELKRKAASLGDLSRLHEGSGSGTLLERAVSLDLKNASVGHPALHIRRLRLPDSSATSIDEADEATNSSSPKKLEATGGLKAASQWGTLEEALRLGINSEEHLQKGSSTESSAVVTTTVLKSSSNEEGAPVSNIEISGDWGPSVTDLSADHNNWNDSLDDEDKPPSLPSSPVPIGKTTITVKENNSTIRTGRMRPDANIVIVESNDRLHNFNNIRNASVQLSTAYTNKSLDSLISLGNATYEYRSRERDRYQPDEDGSMVTVTMVPVESHPTAVMLEPPPVPPKPKSNRPLSSPPELIMYENITGPPSIVTVSHGNSHENGDIAVDDTTDHNISDEFISPESSPQKSMTQITLEGNGVSGYTVTEGPFSRMVIISNPELDSSVSIIPTERGNSLPDLNTYHEK